MTDKQNKDKNKQNPSIDRRDFLQGLAATPVLGLFGAALIHEQSVKKKLTKAKPKVVPENLEPLNIAVIGSGAQGQVLIDAMLKLPGLHFKAVCDIWTEYNLKRAAGILKRYGHPVNRYIDYRDMLVREQDLDAVVIASPDFWHADHAVACLEAGLHVYCEKEMSNTLEGAHRMVMASRKAGKLLQIGHQRRSNPRYLHCYDKLIREAKLLGRMTSVNGQWNRAVQPDLGWPEKYAIQPDILRKYGFDSMHQFRNWRWFKNLGGGPIVDLGSHQIDIYNWFLKARPKSVLASGGTDYYDPAAHEWYDTVLAIYEYETPAGTVRAFYQTLTSNSSEGYFENFLGDEGTLHISESSNRGGVYREPNAPQWDEWVRLGYLSAPEKAGTQATSAVLDVRETIAPDRHDIPIVFTDPYHMPHLENFFNTVRGLDTLNCPAETGYETAVTVLKVNEAVKAGKQLAFSEQDFLI
ncbi:Gfo/Idh/MocA family oxidoreductase [bacterium]|nr:Gfo/Idh/MocA family oxidoreductase [bacterium]